MNNLILRAANSPYNDITKGTVLSQVELDNNFVSLKGEVIYTAETNNRLITLKKINGDNIVFELEDDAVTGGTYDNTTGVVTFVLNNGETFDINGFFKPSDDVFATGGTYSNGTVVINNNNGNSFDISGLYTGSTDVFVTGATYNSGTTTFTNVTGGTFDVTGYYTGSTDVFVTGGTYSNGITTFTNTSGGTFDVSGFSTGSTDTFVTGMTFNTGNYDLTIGRNDGVDITQNLGILSSDMTITGGTYNNGTATFTNNSGGTFNVTGFLTGSTAGDYWISGSTGLYSVKALNDTTIDATGNYSHAEGVYTQASGEASHAEGNSTIAGGFASHAEGILTQANGNYSHAEGVYTQASGGASHAEGNSTIAGGFASHAEGILTQANGNYSHAEGISTQANGYSSHAGGSSTIANNTFSFVHGSNSIANGQSTIVLGSDITGNTDNTTYVDNLNIKTVGSGASVANLGVDASGNVAVGGGITGTENYLPKITGGTSAIDSQIFDDGVNVGVNASTFTGNPLWEQVFRVNKNSFELVSNTGEIDLLADAQPSSPLGDSYVRDIKNVYSNGNRYQYYSEYGPSGLYNIFYHPIGYLNANGSSTYFMYTDLGYDDASKQTTVFQLNGNDKLSLMENGDVVIGSSNWYNTNSYQSTLRASDANIFASNTIGKTLNIQGGKSRGTGAGGSINFGVSASGSTGSVLNNSVNKMTITPNGKVNILQMLNISSISVYADNTAATSGGLDVGDVYRTSTGVLMVRY